MSTFETLEPIIQDHIRQIAKTSGLPAGPDTYEMMADAWLEKKTCFEEALAGNDLEEVSFFGRAEARGALVLTYSGSLLNIGPQVEGLRRCEYTSIGMRTDVPASAVEEASVLEADLEADEPARFEKGPIKSSSPVFKIAVAKAKLEAEEEEALLTQVSQGLAEDFVEVNKTVIE
ncbi:MAG TPA: hypothetical protein P5117_12275 [Spirochaetia bacterium]|nr:hypothetical protein [Spirochaetia bacterium]HRZ90248.1 hypothetical protein [Spirochaetia bacterium]